MVAAAAAAATSRRNFRTQQNILGIINFHFAHGNFYSIRARLAVILNSPPPSPEPLRNRILRVEGERPVFLLMLIYELIWRGRLLCWHTGIIHHLLGGGGVSCGGNPKHIVHLW